MTNNDKLAEALRNLEEAARRVQAGEMDAHSIQVERNQARAALAAHEAEAKPANELAAFEHWVRSMWDLGPNRATDWQGNLWGAWQARATLEAKPAPALWPLAPLTGYYNVDGKRVWLEKDEPFPTTTPTAPAEPVAFDAAGFREWVKREIPDGMIVNSGDWWADHLTARAQRFVKAAPAAPAPMLDKAVDLVQALGYCWTGIGWLKGDAPAAPAPQLPPMPEPHWPRYYQGSVPPGAYTADQMQTYARAAIAASKGGVK